VWCRPLNAEALGLAPEVLHDTPDEMTPTQQAPVSHVSTYGSDMGGDTQQAEPPVVEREVEIHAVTIGPR
jgi:hypothetical protein